MKFNKWIALFLLAFLHFNSNAQTDKTFPVSGVFQLQDETGSRPKDFNKVSIESNTFSLWKDNQRMRSYKIVAETKGGFKVEQFFLENETPAAEAEKFNIRINEITANECAVVIIYPQGSEKIHLVRQQ